MVRGRNKKIQKGFFSVAIIVTFTLTIALFSIAHFVTRKEEDQFMKNIENFNKDLSSSPSQKNIENTLKFGYFFITKDLNGTTLIFKPNTESAFKIESYISKPDIISHDLIELFKNSKKTRNLSIDFKDLQKIKILNNKSNITPFGDTFVLRVHLLAEKLFDDLKTNLEAVVIDSNTFVLFRVKNNSIRSVVYAKNEDITESSHSDYSFGSKPDQSAWSVMYYILANMFL